jgi:pimeloyl-ACP methyl ester carboxylesterase
MADPWHFEKITLPNGLNMRVARPGTGTRLVVMLHGFPESWYSWRHQLRALASGFDCVAPEMRGYGETDAPRGVKNYRIEKLVGDVAGLIEALGYQRATVVGHDWGGAVAWATAQIRPDRVERLCVMNCPHLRKFLEHVHSNPRQMLRSWYMLFFQLPLLADTLLWARGSALVPRLIRTSAFNKAAFSAEDLAQFRTTFRQPYSATAAVNYYRALKRRDFLLTPPPEHWLMRKIQAPTLLVWGEHDVALGKELTYDMEGLFNGPFTVKYIADSGHWVQQERPEIVNQYLTEFLDQAPRDLPGA